MNKERLENYFLNLEKNCAESVFLAAADEYKLNISEDTIKAVGVFGGGIACGSFCGAAAGAVCALGVKYSTGHAHGSDEMQEKCSLFMGEFIKEFDSGLCNDIKPIHRHPEFRCLSVVEKAYAIMDKYMV